MTFVEYYTRVAARLPDDVLLAELACAKRCALCSTRARRDLALIRLRCLDCELQRRRAMSSAGGSSISARA
jgi:hypothetical protein